MFKKIISLTIAVCMLLCFAACGNDDNESNVKTNNNSNVYSNNSKVEVPLRAATYEEAVQMYFDALFDPEYNSENIKYLAPEGFWGNILGDTTLDEVIEAHKRHKTQYIGSWYDDIEPGHYYSLKTLQKVNEITPDSNYENYYKYTNKVEDKYKIKIDKDSTIYYVDEVLVDSYEGSKTGKYLGTEEIELDAIVFQVDGIWYTHEALQYLKESPIEDAQGQDHD